MSNTCLYSISKQRKKIRRKRAIVAPYSMLYRFLCNALQRASQKAKKYGANAPQLHPILTGIVVIVGARAVEWGGGDPCGRPGVCQHPIFCNDDLDKSLDMTCGRPGVCQLSTRWARAIMK